MTRRSPPAPGLTTATAIAVALLALSVGACSKHDDPAPPEAPAEAVAPLDQRAETVPDAPVVPPPPAATEVNMMAEAPAEVAPAPDERMMDDASATGMTARSTRGETATDEPQPAGQVENK